VSKVFNQSVNATKVEVTDDTKILIYSITLHNGSAIEGYLQVFDLDADDVTVGTTTSTFVIGNEATSQIHCPFPKPILFTSGLTLASTSTRANSTDSLQEVTITYASEA